METCRHSIKYIVRYQARGEVEAAFAQGQVHITDQQYQPGIYKDGKPIEEIMRDERERKLNRFLGGKLRATDFGSEVIEKFDVSDEPVLTPQAIVR